jgi:hypothetical protein
MNLMNLIGLIRVNHDQCFFDLWRCQQPILDVLLVFASTASLQKISTNVVKRPMPIPKPRPWDILQQDKQIKQGVAPRCIFWNILARDLPTVFQSMGQGSELSSISAAKATVLGQILGATLWWEICKQNEPMHDMEIT